VIFGFLDLPFDNPGSFAAFGKAVFGGLATVFWAEPGALVLGNAVLDNAVFGATGFLGEGTFWDNAAFLATGFWGEVSFLVFSNAVFGATGLLDEASLFVFDNAVFCVLGGVCFLVLVDFLLIGWEVLVIVFLDFSALALERLFADIANLLTLE